MTNKTKDEKGKDKMFDVLCYKCGALLTIDPIGYSPPCVWCPKCNEIRDNNYDEDERIRQDLIYQAKKEVFDDIEKEILPLEIGFKNKQKITLTKVLQHRINGLKKRHLSTDNGKVRKIRS